MSALPYRQVPEPANDDEESLRAHRIDLCTKYMTYRRDGKIDQLRPLLTSDCVLHCPAQIPGSIFTGIFHGPDAIIARLHDLFIYFETLELELPRFIADGDDIAVMWEATMRNRGSGPAHRTDGIALVRFRGDRFCYVSNNLDTALLDGLKG